jgi:hypothetical protein
MNIRKFDIKKDAKAAFNILNEAGWVDNEKSEYIHSHLKNGRSLAADIEGNAEAIAVSHFGKMKYQQEDLKFSAVTGVICSFLARQQGLAAKLTARRLAEDAADGAEISGLTIFDQGFYNKLGYGNGNYLHLVAINPASLYVPRKTRNPIRLTKEDFQIVHANRLQRMHLHGAVDLPELITKIDMAMCKDGLGLGFKDENGNLTHHMWLMGKGKEDGPLRIFWMSYQNYNQMIELFSVLKSLQDQIALVRFVEPPNIIMQDLLDKPMFYRKITHGGKFKNEIKASNWWQARILDLEKCIAKTHLENCNLKFNLELSDPISKYLPEDSIWKGIGGSYVVELSKNSRVERGHKENLPTLTASVGAFTRLWLGVAKASSLAVTDEFAASQKLIRKLDVSINLPIPRFDWGF